MKEHIGEKSVAGDDAGGCAVIDGMDGRGVFDGVELALRFHGGLDAMVVIHGDSFDPGHSLQLPAPGVRWKTILNRRAAPAAKLRIAPICGQVSNSWSARARERRSRARESAGAR